MEEEVRRRWEQEEEERGLTSIAFRYPNLMVPLKINAAIPARPRGKASAAWLAQVEDYSAGGQRRTSPNPAPTRRQPRRQPPPFRREPLTRQSHEEAHSDALYAAEDDALDDEEAGKGIVAEGGSDEAGGR